MATEKLRVGDIGSRIIVDVGRDISSGISLGIYYVKPSGDSGYWSALPSSDNPNYIEYITKENDIDEAGDWKLQSWIEYPTWSGSGTPTKIKVGANIFSN